MRKEVVTIVPNNQHREVRVWIEDNLGNRISRDQVFKVLPAPCDATAFIWLNKRGGFDSHLFLDKPEEVLNTSRNVFYRQQQDDLNAEMAVLNIESNKENVVYSNYLTTAEKTWLEGIFESPVVFMVDSSTGQKKLVPVVVLNKDQQTNGRGLIRYELEYTPAHSRLNQNTFKVRPLADTTANGGLEWQTVWS